MMKRKLTWQLGVMIAGIISTLTKTSVTLARNAEKVGSFRLNVHLNSKYITKRLT
jgi:hypothetical protein